MIPGVQCMAWTLEEEELLYPSTRAVNLQAPRARKLGRALIIHVWASKLHEEEGTLPGDWTALGLHPQMGMTGSALTTSGETIRYVKAKGTYWVLYRDLILKVYYCDPSDYKPWVWRPILWKDKRSCSMLLGEVVVLWPKRSTKEFAPLLEPMYVVSVLWDANAKKCGLGLAPMEENGATGVTNTKAWPFRNLQDIDPKTSRPKTLAAVDAQLPALVLWPSSAQDNPTVRGRMVMNRVEVPVWTKLDTPFSGFRLTIYDPVGANPMVWKSADAMETALLQELGEETVADGTCYRCADEGQPGVPESLEGSNLCTKHRAEVMQKSRALKALSRNDGVKVSRPVFTFKPTADQED